MSFKDKRKGKGLTALSRWTHAKVTAPRASSPRTRSCTLKRRSCSQGSCRRPAPSPDGQEVQSRGPVRTHVADVTSVAMPIDSPGSSFSLDHHVPAYCMPRDALEAPRSEVQTSLDVETDCRARNPFMARQVAPGKSFARTPPKFLSKFSLNLAQISRNYCRILLT